MIGDIPYEIVGGNLRRDDLVALLSLGGDEIERLFEKAMEVRKKYVGDKVHMRGLIELSNTCAKNCYYCGIRAGNKEVSRYFLEDDQVFHAAEFAYKNGFGSLAIQSGERSDREFIDKIEYLITEIGKRTNNSLGITLSCGEQTEETYRRWFDAGAHRYLLRIESSSQELYHRIHPRNAKHDFNNRLKSLEMLKKIGYQVGTGVMIGLPHQTAEHLADDILFYKRMDVDMIGMGPYIPHIQTPMWHDRGLLNSDKERFELGLKMIAVTRILLKDVNIASTTALETLSEKGRLKGILAGANIIMPNITPPVFAKSYKLYENKPISDGNVIPALEKLHADLKDNGLSLAFNSWGDSKHYFERNLKN